MILCLISNGLLFHKCTRISYQLHSSRKFYWSWDFDIRYEDLLLMFVEVCSLISRGLFLLHIKFIWQLEEWRRTSRKAFRWCLRLFRSIFGSLYTQCLTFGSELMLWQLWFGFCFVVPLINSWIMKRKIIIIRVEDRGLSVQNRGDSWVEKPKLWARSGIMKIPCIIPYIVWLTNPRFPNKFGKVKKFEHQALISHGYNGSHMCKNHMERKQPCFLFQLIGKCFALQQSCC